MKLTRKQFLTQSALATSALFALPRFSIGKPGRSANNKLNVAIIGAGGMGRMAVGASKHDNIVAFCDVDATQAAQTFDENPNIPIYTDFRVMLEKHHHEIDVVCVPTPDHTHFPATMAAMELGKHVFTQKPLTHDIWQSRTLQKAANHYGVKNVMGNQGRCSNGIRSIKEWIDSGLIGDVSEVHAWTIRPYRDWSYDLSNGLPSKMPIPTSLDWDNWLGPVTAIEDYNKCYLPGYWRAWWDFGNSAMGDIGCHLLDAPYWALDLTGPVSVQSEANDFNEYINPSKGITTMTYPARGDKVPVTIKWYEGGLKPEIPEGFDFGKELPQEGLLIKGSKHTIFHADIRPKSPMILMERRDWAEFRKTELPAETITRLPKWMGPVPELYSAIRGERKVGSDFDYAAPLTELCCLGALAMRTGKQLDYDPATMTFKNSNLNPYIKAPVRKGWEYGENL